MLPTSGILKNILLCKKRLKSDYLKENLEVYDETSITTKPVTQTLKITLRA